MSKEATEAQEIAAANALYSDTDWLNNLAVKIAAFTSDPTHVTYPENTTDVLKEIFVSSACARASGILAARAMITSFKDNPKIVQIVGEAVTVVSRTEKAVDAACEIQQSYLPLSINMKDFMIGMSGEAVSLLRAMGHRLGDRIQ